MVRINFFRVIIFLIIFISVLAKSNADITVALVIEANNSVSFWQFGKDEEEALSKLPKIKKHQKTIFLTSGYNGKKGGYVILQAQFTENTEHQFIYRFEVRENAQQAYIAAYKSLERDYFNRYYSFYPYVPHVIAMSDKYLFCV